MNEERSLAVRLGQLNTDKPQGRPKRVIEDFEEIRRRHSAGESVRALADEFNIPRSTLHHRLVTPRKRPPPTPREVKMMRRKLLEFRKKNGSHKIDHSTEKRRQIKRVLSKYRGASVYELYAGRGRCTEAYLSVGCTPTSKTLADGDALDVTAIEVASGRRYDVVDSDEYGYTKTLILLKGGQINDALLRKHGFLFLTLGINAAPPSPTTKKYWERFTGCENPGMGDLIKAVEEETLLHGRKARAVDCLRLGGVYRLCFYIHGKGKRYNKEGNNDGA